MNILKLNSSAACRPELLQEMLATSCSASKKELTSSFYASLILPIIFWSHISTSHLVPWLLYMIMICGYRYYSTRKYQEFHITEKNVLQRKSHLTLCLWLTAAGWGAAGLIFFQPYSHEYQLVLIMCLTMVCITAAPSTTLITNIAVGYLIICLSPVTFMVVLTAKSLTDTVFATLSFIILLLLHQIIAFNKNTSDLLMKKLAYKDLLLANETEKKKVQSLFHAIEASIDAIYITDLEGKITFTNDAYCKLTGWSHDELLGENPRIMESRNWPDGSRQKMWQNLGKNEDWTGRILNHRKNTNVSITQAKPSDFSEYWCQSTISPIHVPDGSILGFVAIQRDITDNIKYEKDLKLKADFSTKKSKISASLQSESPLKERFDECLSILLTLSELKLQERACILLIDSRTDHLELFTQKGNFDESLKSQCEEVIANGLFKILNLCETSCNQEGQETQHCYYFIPLTHEKNILGVLLLYTDADTNTDREQEHYQQKFLCEIGNLMGQTITNDRIQKNLQRSHQEAVRTTKIKSEFLANMSHEIRTPMNGVLGMTELLLNTSLSKKQTHLAKTIQRSGKSLLHIIKDILDFSKIEAGKLELFSSTFDLHQLFEDIGSLYAESAHRKGLELICHHPFDLQSMFHADKERIKQVLTNLVGNAIKFTAQGEVSLISKICHEDNESATLLFEIKDTGIGIPEAEMEKIFDSFSQADGSTTRNFGGTGLGLSISKQLIDLMQGEIGVKSISGQGSTFWFRIKLDKEKTKNIARQNKFDQHKLAGKNILIIDGNETGRAILCAQMKSWKINYAQAKDLKQAITTLENNFMQNETFDLIILDDKVLEANNKDLKNILLDNPQYEQSGIILLTSTSPSYKKEPFFHNQIKNSLIKPVRQIELFQAITKSIQPAPIKPPLLEHQTQPSKDFNLHVLVAEDNETNQQIVELMLEQLGCEITLVENGQQAVKAIIENETNFDLVLMDCQMPIMDGFTATRKIRENLTSSETKIIALTANAMRDDKEHCLRVGMNDYLSKPFTQEQLQAMLEKWVELTVE